ncbi:MAG: VWA domain-containing protein [Chloroflexota bacterium]
MRNRGRNNRVVGLTLGLLLLLIAVPLIIVSLSRDEAGRGAAGERDSRGRPVLTVAYSPEKAQLFERVVGEFNRQNSRYSVRATKVDMADMLSQASAGDFAAISPDSAIWLGNLDQQWLAGGEDRANLVGSLSRYALSPVVIAAWQSEAQKMGYPDKAIGWADLANRATAEPNFRWSHPSSTTAAGLLATTAEFYAASNKTSRLTKEDLASPAAQEYVRRLERTVQQYGGESEDQVLERLLNERQRTLDAFVAQEALVVRFNRQSRGEKLVAIYPREGTLWMDHPLALLEGPWLTPEHRRAFQEFGDFLRSGPMQRIVMQEGYRPAELSVSLDEPESQIKTANGVDPAQPQTLLPVPSAGVVESLRNAWVLLKRPANIMLVADTSGSMSGEKLTRAQEALNIFVEQVGGSDRVGLITFASEAREEVPLGDITPTRARLTDAIGRLRASGNTALYDGVLLAAERLHTLRQSDRINVVVVMSDGLENASRRVRSGRDPQPLITALQDLNRRDSLPVLVFGVAYGGDADLAGLQRLGESTRAQAYRGDPETIRKLYQLLSAFFS